MATAPIQVILRADDYRRDRITSTPKGAGIDFFEGKDAEFGKHKAWLAERVQSLKQQIVDFRLELSRDFQVKLSHPFAA